MSTNLKGHTKFGELSMNQEKEYFRMILCRTIYGQAQIKSLLNVTMQTKVRRLLILQKKEYHHIETQIRAWIAINNIRLREPDPLFLYLSRKLIQLRFQYYRKDAHTISYMILRSMQGKIACFQVLNKCPSNVSTLYILAQNLLDCEQSFILQMQELL